RAANDLCGARSVRGDPVACDPAAAAAVQSGRGPLRGDPARDARGRRLGRAAPERPRLHREAAAAILGHRDQLRAVRHERLRVAPDWSPWRRLHLRLGLPLFLAITVPWFWLAARRLPDFLEFFFVREHFARYLTNVADREQAWWFFGPVFLAGSLPWTFAGLRALATGWRRRAAPGTFDAQLFLWIWVVFVLAFFSLSDSKLIPYVLPAMPALALLIGGSPLSV